MKTGEIYWVNLDPTLGDEIKKRRPVVVLSGGHKKNLKLAILRPLSWMTIIFFPAQNILNIELNSVRAGLVKRPEEWPFSSARTHIEGRDDILIKSKPMIDRISKPWGMFLSDDVGEHEMDRFRKHERTGRSMGEESFIDKLECYLDRTLKPQKPGPKCRDSNN
ncbi:MAG: type II toxin-antitoxin system PemK/MazF family toxin [Thermodesulfobacteriota bacterium]|nr:type II toxin-antitoxin system PemK/MazF family toxin [Thermodesulfobacteriota bacterium]